MENVDKIAKTKVGGQDKPKKEIKIINLKIEKYNGKKLVDFKLDKDEAIKAYNDSTKNAMEAKKNALKAKREANKNKVLKNGDTVSVHYTLTVDGKKKDSSLGKQPFIFTLGKKMVIKGWDKGLVGHKIGDKFELEVEPKDGYGEYDKSKTQTIPKEQLAEFEKAGFKLEKGTILPTQMGNIKIIDSNEKEVIIDDNHELAGKKLFFDIEIVDIK
jgi:FKBP-type peptidyl-prolyl cis-trans isomerase 2